MTQANNILTLPVERMLSPEPVEVPAKTFWFEQDSSGRAIVTKEQLLDLYAAAYRMGEAQRLHEPHSLLVASDKEIRESGKVFLDQVFTR